MDIAQAFNAPESIPFAGGSYPVRQLRLEEWAGLMAFLKAHYQSPVTVAILGLQEARGLGVPLDQELVDLVTAAALAEARKWPPKVGTRAWLRALDSIHTGTATFLQAVLAAGGTVLDLHACQRLADQADQADFDELVRVAYFGDPPGPKVGKPATTPAPARSEPTANPTTGGPSCTDFPGPAGPMPISGV